MDAMVLSGCRICGNLTYDVYTLKAAPAASADELRKTTNRPKQGRILVGCDVHLLRLIGRSHNRPGTGRHLPMTESSKLMSMIRPSCFKREYCTPPSNCTPLGAQ
jgi:hypothetical protein